MEESMKFGIISVFPPARSALDRMRLAERLGFDTFWLTDSHVIWNECYSHMGWLSAQITSDELQLGTMVTNPISRDPIVVASAFATLQDLSGGRMLCGIGRGDSSVRVLQRTPATIKAFGEAAAMIQALTRGDAIEVNGATAKFDWATGGGVPVYIAAYGPKMLTLAGRIGDGVIIECAHPGYLSWALEHVHTGAREMGRNPSDVQVIVTTATYVGDDLGQARDQVRPLGALVGNHVAEVVRNLGTGNLPAELESFIVQRPEYDYAHHIRTGTEQERYVPDEMVDRLCIVGTPDRCVERVCELADLGVTHINFYAQTDNFEQQMEIWGQDIIPRT
jgi:probable F420-dependent oxidoreductase